MKKMFIILVLGGLLFAVSVSAVSPQILSQNFNVSHNGNLVKVQYMTNLAMGGGIKVKINGVKEKYYSTDKNETYHTIFFRVQENGEYSITPEYTYKGQYLTLHPDYTKTITITGLPEPVMVAGTVEVELPVLNFKKGLTEIQKNSIYKLLAKKSINDFNSNDLKHYNYAIVEERKDEEDAKKYKDTSMLIYKKGLTDKQKESIYNLCIKKAVSDWSDTDIANFEYATI